MAGRLPEPWIAPEHLLELRSRVRLRHTLVDQRGEWQQRIQAQLFHHGVPRRRDLLVAERRAWLEALEPPDAARTQIAVALVIIDALGAELAPLNAELRAFAHRQPGCRALMAHYGHRAADRGRDPGRAGRLSALWVLDGRGPLQRPGHHRRRDR